MRVKDTHIKHVQFLYNIITFHVINFKSYDILDILPMKKGESANEYRKRLVAWKQTTTYTRSNLNLKN